jgi:hypothetical protein
MLHTKVRNANALGLYELKDETFQLYKQQGGKRTLSELLRRKPIYQ